MTELVEKITAESTGIYLVKTQGSTHLWNLDEGWYVRNPTRTDSTYSEVLRGLGGLNGTQQPLEKVERYPEVGGTFMVFLPPPHNYHRSSQIRSIERIPTDVPQG